MARVRAEHTAPEVRLSRALRFLPEAFDSHVRNLPGQPDFVCRRRKLVVFVDGDFWHGHQWRARGLQSLEAQFRDTPNRSYWIKKITGNIRRDARVNRQLRAMGWRVARLRESEIKTHMERCIRRIERMLGHTR